MLFQLIRKEVLDMEWFLKVVKENYANFNGRARRKEYWMFTLFSSIISIVLFVLMSIFSDSMLVIIFSILSILYSLVILIPSLAVIARRLHDTNHSGWFYFIALIPLVGPIIMLITLCKEGTRGDNQYGADPKAGDLV
jgi:uncharacterized membrane protein YhaH (DUF805 family)